MPYPHSNQKRRDAVTRGGGADPLRESRVRKVGKLNGTHQMADMLEARSLFFSEQMKHNQHHHEVVKVINKRECFQHISDKKVSLFV